MRSLVWTAPRQMVIEERARPALKEGWVLIAVHRVGICGSDVSGFLGQNELRKPPLVMGHEFTGAVTELGPGVSEEWRDQLVTVNPLVTCGECRFCKSGARQICSRREVLGINYSGAFAEYVAAPASSCYKVKDAVAGAVVEPLGCGVRAAALSGAVPGDSVLVIGAGSIGLMVVRMMKARGVKDCIVVDTNSNRLRWALNWGATAVSNPKTDDVASLVKSATAGDGMDAVVDAVGSGQTRAQSLSLTRRGGSAVWLGLHENAATIPGNEIVRLEKRVVGSFSYSDDDFRRAVSLANGGFIETTSGWLDTRGMSSGQESFLEQASDTAPYSKILLDPMK